MSDRKQVAVIGAGGHGKVVISTLAAAGHEVTALYDDSEERRGARNLGVPVLGSTAELAARAPGPAVAAIGDNRARRRLAELELEWLSVVHPRAVVHRSVEIGAGTVVFAGAVVQPDTRLGAHCIVNTGALIDHDCAVGDFAHVAPGARLAGGVTVGEGALLGVGCSIVPGVRIGDWAVVGAGAVVVTDVEPGVTVMGVPAR